MSRRILNTLLPMLLIPVVHFGILMLIGFARHQSFVVAFATWRVTLLEFIFYPYVIINGVYPTHAKINQMTLWDIGLVACFAVLSWFILSRIFLYIFRKIKLSSRIKLSVFLLIIGMSVIFSFGWRITHAPAPLPDVSVVIVDVSRQLGEFPHHQRGFSQGGEGQMMQEGYFESAMDIMAEIRPKYIRIDHLYDYYDVLNFDDEGNAVYDFSQLDRIINAILDAGAEPLMSLSYTPPVLAQQTVYAPPIDLTAWEALVYETVKYYNVERGLNIQYWEVWNEPNLSHFWNGTIQDYLDLYTATAKGIKRADPSAWVGGPATASITTTTLPVFPRSNEETWFLSLIRHIQENNIPLDFVSWHFYSPTPQLYIQNIHIHEEWLSQLDPSPPMLLTEWNYTAGKSSAMDTGQSVAYLAQTLSTLSLSNLEQAFYFEPIDGGEDWINSWGLIRADGTRKASFYAFNLFDRLDGNQLFMESNHPQVGAIATQNDDQFTILVWNNTDTDELVSIFINGLELNSININIEGVDNTNGNPFYEHGKTDTFVETIVHQVSDSLNLKIPAYGIRLLEFATTND